MDAPIRLSMEKKFPRVEQDTSLAQLAALLRTEPYACVLAAVEGDSANDQCGGAKGVVKHLITRKELLDYFAAGKKENKNTLAQE